MRVYALGAVAGASTTLAGKSRLPFERSARNSIDGEKIIRRAWATERGGAEV